MKLRTGLILALCAAVGLATTALLAWSVIAPVGGDWRIMVRAAQHLGTDPYESGTYVYTPLFTYFFAWVLQPLGWGALALLHLLSLVALRDRLLAALALLTPAFWMTVALGNVYWFTVVVGILALRGNRFGGLATVFLFALLPRPLMVPLVAWLLWKQSWIRLPAVAVLVFAIVANVATGYADEWWTAAVSISADYPWEGWNVGPTRIVGLAWLVAGVPLAVWLTYRGHVGWAGLAMSQYVVPPHFLVLLFEVDQLRLPKDQTVRAAKRPGRLADYAK